MSLAASNPNEDEAASAHAKAQELLLAYNLNMSMVDDINNTGQRAMEELDGGKHQWQQDIWEAVAELNFCMYFNTQVWVESRLFKTFEMKVRNGKYVKVYGSYVNRHNVIGRAVNIAATRTMAQYLEEVAERLAKETCRANNEKTAGRWANNFKTGVSLRLVSKINDRRHDLLTEEKQKQADALKAAMERANGAVPATQALTIASHSEAEKIANYDFQYGDGAYQKLLDERAERARLDKEADERYTRWAEAHPEEARRQEKEAKRQAAKAKRNDDAWYRRYVNRPGFAAGYRAGANISIDQQADQKKPKGLLT